MNERCKEQTGWAKKGNNNLQFFVSKYNVSHNKKHVSGCVPAGFGEHKKVIKMIIPMEI